MLTESTCEMKLLSCQRPHSFDVISEKATVVVRVHRYGAEMGPGSFESFASSKTVATFSCTRMSFAERFVSQILECQNVVRRFNMPKTPY